MKVGLVPDDVLLVPRPVPNPDDPDEAETFADGIPLIIPDEVMDDPENPDYYDRDTSSRSNVDLSTWIDAGRTIRLRRPIVSAPMLDVTASELAIALAQAGGLGIIHRGFTVDEQVGEVEKTREAMGIIFEHPPTMPGTATIAEARAEMERANRGLVVVTDPDNKVQFVVTRRNVKPGWVPDDHMTLEQSHQLRPQRPLVSVTQDIDTQNPQDLYVVDRATGDRMRATDLMWMNEVEKLIILDNEGRLAGAITDYDLRTRREYPLSTVDQKGKVIVGAALGIGERQKVLYRAERLVEAGASLLCVDVANAYIHKALDTIAALRKQFPDVAIMGGSVATRAGVRGLVKAGATSIRNNIGSGSICITRGVSGFGYPSLSSVLESADEGDKYGVPVVADGGIDHSSQMVKFLAAGARAVMLGKVLARAKESSGPRQRNPETGEVYVIYRGMASDSARRTLEAAEAKLSTAEAKRPEGVERTVKERGTVAEIVEELCKGAQSGFTYGGVVNIEQLRNEVDFVRITPAGQRESGVEKDL